MNNETMKQTTPEQEITPAELMQLKQDRPEVYEFISEAMKLSGEEIGILAAELKLLYEERQERKAKGLVEEQAIKGRAILGQDPGSNLTLSEINTLYKIFDEEENNADGLFNIIDLVFHMGANAGYQIANIERTGRNENY